MTFAENTVHLIGYRQIKEEKTNSTLFPYSDECLFSINRKLWQVGIRSIPSAQFKPQRDDSQSWLPDQLVHPMLVDVGWLQSIISDDYPVPNPIASSNDRPVIRAYRDEVAAVVRGNPASLSDARLYIQPINFDEDRDLHGRRLLQVATHCTGRRGLNLIPLTQAGGDKSPQDFMIHACASLV